MLTLIDVLRGYDPAGGRPVPLPLIYAANTMTADEWRIARLRAERDEYRRRLAAREEQRDRLREIAAAGAAYSTWRASGHHGGGTRTGCVPPAGRCRVDPCGGRRGRERVILRKFRKRTREGVWKTKGRDAL